MVRVNLLKYLTMKWDNFQKGVYLLFRFCLLPSATSPSQHASISRTSAMLQWIAAEVDFGSMCLDSRRVPSHQAYCLSCCTAEEWQH